MKEFLFRYKSSLLFTTVILGVWILIGHFNLMGDTSSELTLTIIVMIVILYLWLVYTIYAIKKQFHFNTGKFKNLNPTYINGKYVFVLSQPFIDTEKEKKYCEKIISEEFGLLNHRFYSNQKNKFKNKGKDFKWASIQLSDALKSNGKVHILDYLVSIATRDKFLSVKEATILRDICKYMKVHSKTLEAILTMHNYQSEEELNRQKEEAKLKRYSSGSLARYYKILELEPTASLDEVKAAYRRLVKIYHPDKQKGKSKSQQFLMVQEAYEKIKNKTEGK